MRFGAVLFDWMLTLAYYPTPFEHVVLALDGLGRPRDKATVDALVERLVLAGREPEVQAAQAVEDTSPEDHRHATFLHYEAAGLDPALARAMYDLLGTPNFHPLYPDAAESLAALHDAGVRIGVVSDIQVDLREHARLAGVDGYVDAWTLSYELGIQKPDPAVFGDALATLDVAPADALMVGDSAYRDAVGAAELGMSSLILTVPVGVTRRGLGAVVDLVCGTGR
jgi:FMN phosphatase YigB (HAD superfamily)